MTVIRNAIVTSKGPSDAAVRLLLNGTIQRAGTGSGDLCNLLPEPQVVIRGPE